MWSLISSRISSENTEKKASSGVLIVAGSSSRRPEFNSRKRDEPTSWFSVACFHPFSSIIGPRLLSPASVGPKLLDLDLDLFELPFPILVVGLDLLAGRGIFSLTSDSLELDLQGLFQK